MRELDARAQDAISSIQQNTTKFITDMRSLPPEDRVKTLQEIATLFKETLKHGEEKVALAVQTYDMVGRRRLYSGNMKNGTDRVAARSERSIATCEDSTMIYVNLKRSK